VPSSAPRTVNFLAGAVVPIPTKPLVAKVTALLADPGWNDIGPPDGSV
jgi:hypothetical protein